MKTYRHLLRYLDKECLNANFLLRKDPDKSSIQKGSTLDFPRVITLRRTIDCDRHRSSKALRECFLI